MELSDKAKAANVLVATPNYTNELSSEVHVNHIELAVNWTKWGLSFNCVLIGRTFVHFARTQMVELVLKPADNDKPLGHPEYKPFYSHVLWLDDDAVIEPDLLLRYIDFDKDVVISPYPMRRPGYEIGVLTSVAHKCDCGWYGYILWSYEDKKVITIETLEELRGEIGDAPDEEAGPEGCPANEDEIVCPKCGSREMWRDFHNHRAYRNLSTFHNLDRGLIEVDGGGTHAMLVKTESFYDRRGQVGGPDAMPTEVTNIVKFIKDNLNEEDQQRYDHYLGDIPDETHNFVEEYQSGKPYFLMPKRGTEDMYWCYRAKRKGIKTFCDSDSFAGHVGFAPVITRGFRDAIERSKYGLGNGEREVKIQKLQTNEDDKFLPIRKPGVHVDKASNII